MSARLQAGRLTREIMIQQRGTANDSYGQQVTTWTDVKRVYAAIEGLTGFERAAAMSVASEVSHRITVRYDPIFADTRVASSYRALYKGRFFNIQYALNVDEADAVVELYANEGLHDG